MPSTPKASVFIASSTQALPVAKAIQAQLEDVAEVTVWSDGAFKISRNFMDNLTDLAAATDYAIFVFNDDDLTIKNKDQEVLYSTRDNVILEFGLFAGKLGWENCFVCCPEGKQTTRSTTDIEGIVWAGYEDPDVAGPAAFRKSIRKLGTELKRAFKERSASLRRHSFSKAVVGKWLEIKNPEPVSGAPPRRPLAIVEIGRGRGEVKLKGVTYLANGKRATSWTEESQFFTIHPERMQILQAYQASSKGDQVNGIAVFNFRHNPWDEITTGDGYYAQHGGGREFISQRIAFRLWKLGESFSEQVLGVSADVDLDAGHSPLVERFARWNAPRKHVLSGATTAGKSTILKGLTGFPVIGEAAAKVLRDTALSADPKVLPAERYQAWRRDNIAQIQRNIADAQYGQERARFKRLPAGSTVVMDRSSLDCIAYLGLAGLEIPQDLKQYADAVRFATAFLLKPPPDEETFRALAKPISFGSLEQAWDTYEELLRLYRLVSDEVVEIDWQDDVSRKVRLVAERLGPPPATRTSTRPG